MTENTQNLDLTEIDPVEASFYQEYEQAAAPKALPPNGSYQLRLPETINDDAFTVRATKEGKRYLEITLDPVTITGGEHDGTAVRFFRVTNRPIVEFVKTANGWTPGRTLAATDANDLLNNFGVSDQPTTVEEWKSAIKSLAGQVTPHTVYLVRAGYDKKAQGKAKYLKSKDFGTGTTVKRVDPATGETYTVFANLQLGRRGAAPRVEAS